MTPASTAPLARTPLAQLIADRLTAALAPSHLEVINDSASHAGHMGDDGTGETHFTLVIDSAAFIGLNRVARQRLVNRALADLLRDRIHALSMRTHAPGER